MALWLCIVSYSLAMLLSPTMDCTVFPNPSEDRVWVLALVFVTVSWMLKVTLGPGEDASTRMSGKSSTSPSLELNRGGEEKQPKLDKHLSLPSHLIPLLHQHVC